jgi:uncharacterized protein (TIGR03000 family)
VSHSTFLRLGSVAAVALAAQTAFAAPPPHVRPAPAPVRVGAPPVVRPVPVPAYRPLPYYGGYGYRSGVSIGIGIGVGSGYGSGLYGPLGYGLGYSPFGYSGLPYGGVGYGALGYGYGYPSTRTVVVGLPATTSISIPYQYIPPSSVPSSIEPMPLPLPQPVPDNGGKGEPATITVITSEGATVTFDDIASEQTGTRHSFTTKPIASGVQSRVRVKVNGPGGASSVSIGVRSGEKATVDMRD